MNKLFILLATAMPGLQKLIMFFVCERILTVSELGLFSSDYSLLFVLSYLYAIGWSGLVLTRVPKLDELSGRRYLISILTTAMIYYFLSLIIIITLSLTGMIADLMGSILFSFCWMVYQITRHYRLSKIQYKRILFADIAFLLIFLMFIFFSVPPLVCISMAALLSSLILIVKGADLRISMVSKEDQNKSFEISANNFLYSSILMGLPFIVNSKGDAELAAIIGYFISIFSITLLLSRGVSLYYIPRMAAAEGNKVRLLLLHFIVINSIVSIAIVGVVIGMYDFIQPFISALSFDVVGNESLLLGLLIAISIGSLSIPASSFLLAKEYTGQLLSSSVLHFMICAFGVALYYSGELAELSLIYVIISGSLLKIIITYLYAYKFIGTPGSELRAL